MLADHDLVWDFEFVLNLSIQFFDLCLVLCYLVGVLAFGVWVGRGQKNTTDYLLGGRSLPWWAILLSIVATETSTVTFLSIPRESYEQGGDFRFLQIAFGYIVGRLLVAAVFLPLYFRGEPFTCYEVLEQRFGVASRRVTSLLFLVTRNLSDSLRLFLSALAIQQAIGLDLWVCVVGLGVVTIIYTYTGGVKSVIWNDCLQFLIYMLGASAALWVIVSKLPGGWEQLVEFGRVHEKFQLFDFNLSLTSNKMTFWSGLIGGMFLTTATHGTDQLMVQRYLAAKSQSGAATAVVLSGVLVLLQFALFLLIGAGLACFYSVFPIEGAEANLPGDQVFAHFIVNHLGVGLVGLTLAAVIAASMSTLSSSLNSSATALVNDLYLPLKHGQLDSNAQLRLSRLASAGFGVLQIAIAIGCSQIELSQSIVSNVLKITGFALGPMLGLYLLAVFAPRVHQKPALVGFGLGVVVLSSIAYGTALYWPWYAAVGAFATLVAGWLMERILWTSFESN